MKKQLLKLASLFALLLFTTTVNAVTWYVSTTGGATAGNTWATATNDLQTAIAAASSGDQVWIAAGDYYPGASLSMKNGVAIYGGFTGTETLLSQRNWVTNPTVINGSLNGGNSIFNNTSNNLTVTAILDGCTVSSASATYGGAMYNYNSSPTIRNCVFSNNYVTDQGGVINNTQSSPTISNCVFSNNFSGVIGGCMANSYSSPIISNCVFSNNNADSYGGAINNFLSSPTISNSVFSSNSATIYGGAIYNINASNTAIINCVFSSNVSQNGGGMYNEQSNPTISNSVFSNNSATYNGGGIHNYQSTNVNINNTIIWGNTANLSNSIYDIFGTSAVNYSTIEGGFAGTGNSSSNPLYVNAANAVGADGIWATADDGLRLQAGSPAINVGSNALIPSGVTTDIAGAARIQVGTVDMGSYEFTPLTPASSLNFDGTNDNVSLPVTIASTLSNGTELTIEYWFKGTNMQSGVRIQDASNNWIVAGWGQGTNPQFLVSTDGGANGVEYGLKSTIEDNTWHHLAGVWKKNKTFTTYLDGVQQHSRIAANVNLPVFSNTITSIGSLNGGAEFINGSIDEVRIWNRALCQAEIQNNMNGEIATTANGLIANYHFNQGFAGVANPTVTTLTDASGNANNGTLNGFSLTGTTTNWVNSGAVTSGSIVTAFVSPTVSIAGAVSICSGATTILTASGNVSSFAWISGPNTSIYAVSPATTTSYSVVGTNSLGCASNMAASTVTVNASPTVTVNSGAICSGKTFTLVPGGASTYTYSGGSPVVTPTVTASYSITGTAVNGCTNIAVSSVTVNALPTVMAMSSNTLVCAGNNASLTATGATSYTWNGGATTSVISVTPSITTTYSVNGTGANGCSNIATITQSVSACTGIEQLSNDKHLVIYPNPSVGIFTIETDEHTTIEVLNTLGETLLRASMNEGSYTLDLSDKADGIYYVNVTKKGGNKVFKLVKN